MLRVLLLPLLLAVCAPVFAGDVDWKTVSTVEDVEALAAGVDSVKVTDADEAEVLIKLAETHPGLKRLRISGFGENSDGIPSLAKFTKLEELTLKGGIQNGENDIHRDRTTEAIGKLTTLKKLTLDLW